VDEEPGLSQERQRALRAEELDPCAAAPENTKARLRIDHAGLDPFALKKAIEKKLKGFFTALGNLDRESSKP
jgi:hypothetical protein